MDRIREWRGHVRGPRGHAYGWRDRVRTWGGGVRGEGDQVPDAALAGGIALLLVVATLVGPEQGGPHGPGPVEYALLLAGTLPLAVRRRLPVVVALVTAVCMTAYSVRTGVGPPTAFPVLVAVHTAVLTGHRAAAVAASVVFLSGDLVAGLSSGTGSGGLPQQSTGLLVGWFVAAGVMGVVSRHRRDDLRRAEERAAEAERTREETARRRADEERLRIARELHDSLTHSISVIKVQAGVAVHLARKRGEEVSAPLLAIQEAGGEAMRELRVTLEVLRDDEPPVSGLDRLTELVERSRATGLPATVVVDGERRPLSVDVDRTAYRIVQEALTNAARHAGPAAASVRITYGPKELTVQIDDDGRADPGAVPTPGVGLSGMRERVTALGGRLRAGPRSEGGFSVRAELPVDGSP
ncbi:histidine kinase [Streptosporangium sp. NPDC049046]|uniref:sensor histidine kinase n=1 Tax=Streptosporangium sp. NPDC049046 TaxID=3155031 RepID=UPI0034364038